MNSMGKLNDLCREIYGSIVNKRVVLCVISQDWVTPAFGFASRRLFYGWKIRIVTSGVFLHLWWFFMILFSTLTKVTVTTVSTQGRPLFYFPYLGVGW